ncbi:hypothetical protein [Streptomyces sp. NPDC051994]|uniref:hypothetical protein n=1 Tax=unclassified Streptomyces TaxID=2593676 RepID=UPI00342D4859
MATPRHATALDKPVGQWLTNCRRPRSLGKDSKRGRAACGAARRGRSGVESGRTGVDVRLAMPPRRAPGSAEQPAQLGEIVPGDVARRRNRTVAGHPTARLAPPLSSCV